MRIKTCACTGAAVNYTPQGMWNAYEKGQPVAITLTLRFNELEPVFDTNYFNQSQQKKSICLQLLKYMNVFQYFGILKIKYYW